MCVVLVRLWCLSGRVRVVMLPVVGGGARAAGGCVLFENCIVDVSIFISNCFSGSSGDTVVSHDLCLWCHIGIAAGALWCVGGGVFVVCCCKCVRAFGGCLGTRSR